MHSVGALGRRTGIVYRLYRCRGEIAMAVAAGLPRKQILVHGVNKSDEDLRSAVRYAGTLVVDHPSELRRLIALIRRKRSLPDIWLRYQPGLAVETHAHTRTGQHGSKFGMAAGDFLQAVQICRRAGLPLNGLHFHQGSGFRDPTPLGPVIASALDLAVAAGFESGWHFCPGGGWGVAYHEDDLPQPPVEEYVRFVAEHVQAGCAKRGLPLPVLHLEPGRSLVARAGAVVYRVGARKGAGEHTWLLVDGGLADNPRWALYGARYSCLTVRQPMGRPTERVSIAGPYCESGDVLIDQIPLRTVCAGELIAVPVSGAYQLSMSSNYNGARRPAVVLLSAGQATLIQRRETIADLLRRNR